ncbi:prolyl oligopeptidase family serine peptidase [Amycolatopsis sp. OK19-0408]|uniref:Prolyl oligopeptidase family serine peptidase n=1 Tax=Amycolatopsis iheyensis TaxID=2945988 RepID=A0A9X2SLP8_9PSEU|nr:prolyl oligopeptidase family serine peptidase [Amycolatopsis iheyensis]MCR6486684.1 prolyl oligopeptidase family serine peptidase [Amycolatopsis iheyensis]
MRIAEQEAVEGVAAGVPFVALPPAGGDAPAALVVGWHLMEVPSSEQAFAEAAPMSGLPAWRVYFGLPLTGSRLPAGGPAELFRLASEDAVLNVFGPVTAQAAAEFPAALAELRDRLPGATGPLGVFGGSAGSLVALEVLTRGDVAVEAAAVVSPVAQLAPVIGRNERLFDITYPWTPESREVAGHYDFVRRAGELTTPLLLVTGADDDVAVREPAAALRDALGAELVTVEGMAHEFAPGSAAAKQVDAAFTEWFARRLRS